MDQKSLAEHRTKIVTQVASALGGSASLGLLVAAALPEAPVILAAGAALAGLVASGLIVHRLDRPKKHAEPSGVDAHAHVAARQ